MNQNDIEKVVEHLKRLKNDFHDKCHPILYSNHCERIDLAISALQAQAERRWIPVSERLPEDGRTILTYTLGGNIEVFLYDSSTYQPVWYGVTHWMPLPEPPKE